jgi:competence protein ComGF
MNQEQLYNSLSPANNRVQLLKSFEKTSGKGGKPLIKTHDKKFLIKELSKSEKDLMIEILSKYRENLDKNPKSILARIYGVFSFKIKEKKKVFHVLMENLDPFDDDFCLFKYDLKFSSINRMELKFDEVETI